MFDHQTVNNLSAPEWLKKLILKIVHSRFWTSNKKWLTPIFKVIWYILLGLGLISVNSSDNPTSTTDHTVGEKSNSDNE